MLKSIAAPRSRRVSSAVNAGPIFFTDPEGVARPDGETGGHAPAAQRTKTLIWSPLTCPALDRRVPLSREIDAGQRHRIKKPKQRQVHAC